MPGRGNQLYLLRGAQGAELGASAWPSWHHQKLYAQSLLENKWQAHAAATQVVQGAELGGAGPGRAVLLASAFNLISPPPAARCDAGCARGRAGRQGPCRAGAARGGGTERARDPHSRLSGGVLQPGAGGGVPGPVCGQVGELVKVSVRRAGAIAGTRLVARWVGKGWGLEGQGLLMGVGRGA
jgi:hypothetical protein